MPEVIDSDEFLINYEINKIMNLRQTHLCCNCTACMIYIKCFRCEKHGHFTENCISVLCNICFKYNHLTSECIRNIQCMRCYNYGHYTKNCYNCNRCNYSSHSYDSYGNCVSNYYKCLRCGERRSMFLNCYCNQEEINARHDKYYYKEINKRKYMRKKWINNFKKRLENYSLDEEREGITLYYEMKCQDDIDKTVRLKKQMHKDLFKLDWINIYDKKKVNDILEKYNTKKVEKIFKNIKILKDNNQRYKKKITFYTNMLNNNDLNIVKNENEIKNTLSYTEKIFNEFKKTEQDFQCSICWNKPEHSKTGITKCGHVFCFTCIVKNVKLNGKCAICRTYINFKDIAIIDNSDEMISYKIGNYIIKV